MKYDVFLVSTQADAAKADLFVKRLRALKFKVRYNKTRDYTTPTPKDIKEANASQSVLVLWSKAACDTTKPDSDWVHAMAHQARSRPGVLLQAGLDKSVPDEPFDGDERYKLSGMTSRTTVKGFYALAEELGRRDGRKDLREWMTLKPADKDAKAAWKQAHPTDPLALVGQAKAKKPAPKAKSKAAAKAAPKAKTATKVAAEAPKTPRRKAKPLVISPPQFDHTQPDKTGMIMLLAIALGILSMFVFALANSSTSAATGIGNACVTVPGPTPILEPGPIIDDTI